MTVTDYKIRAYYIKEWFFCKFSFFLLFFAISCRMNVIFSFMHKIFIMACICLSFFGIFSVYAQDNFNDIGFTVDLWKMDPLGWSHSWSDNGDAPRGISAFSTILSRITDILLIVIPLLAAVSLLIAGYYYIFSAWDSEKVGRAKTIIKWNIVALFVAFLSYWIVSIVASFFNNL